MIAELLGLHRHVRDANGRTEPALSSGPRFAHPLARRFQHRIVNFLELHAGPAHPNKRDEGGEHFIRPLPDLVNAGIAQHSLQR